MQSGLSMAGVMRRSLVQCMKRALWQYWLPCLLSSGRITRRSVRYTHLSRAMISLAIILGELVGHPRTC